jgi:hypothetical protein
LGAWGIVGLVLIFLHWMLPFLGTMSRHVRRKPVLVFAWSVYILIMHYFDVYWMIMPEAHSGTPGALANAGGPIGILACAVTVLGMVTLMSGLVLRVASGTHVVPVRDPRLRESIAFENI